MSRTTTRRARRVRRQIRHTAATLGSSLLAVLVLWLAAGIVVSGEGSDTTPLSYSPASARELGATADPVGPVAERADPTVGDEEPPPCAKPLTVAVVGDSMLEVSEQRLVETVGQGRLWRLVNWDARSGETVIGHPRTFSQSADVVVVSFMYNDIGWHGWPEVKAHFLRLLQHYADRDVVWVSFAEGEGGAVGDAYAWLRRRALEGQLSIAEFGPLHDQFDEWALDQTGLGAFHLDPDGGGVPVLAQTIRAELESLAAQRFGPGATPCGAGA